MGKGRTLVFCPLLKWLMSTAEGLGIELDPEGEDTLTKGVQFLISRHLQGADGL